MHLPSCEQNAAEFENIELNWLESINDPLELEYFAATSFTR